MRTSAKAAKVSGDPSLCGGYAHLRLTVIKSYGFKDNIKEENYRMEETISIPVDSLITEGSVVASVTSSVSTKVSDAVYYPPEGTWDKIPYSVDVFSSVTLQCDQTDESIRMGQRMANQLAWEASRKHIYSAVAGHVVDIKQRLCVECFPKEGEE
ncbi:MAG: hypothetical protein CL582_21785 [Alteromonadaceae bacterium]|nr:hypothetical protein [Alteromonadaceae bacterium]|tara:strand:+ start:5134 stop:5598 length:465 start_codon:yes stop_codon:yes gene_type:complete